MPEQFHRYQFNVLLKRHAVAIAMLMEQTGLSYDQINERIDRTLERRSLENQQSKDS